MISGLLTVDEYIAAPFWNRLQYRLYRNPIVMFGLGPIFLFLITNRLNRKGARKERTNEYVCDKCFNYAFIYTFDVW